MDSIGEVDLVNHIECKKSAVVMRMSDDVLNLLEEYALNQNGSSSKLTIKFDDSNGVINMPNGETYNFSITGSTARHDSTYCIQETENKTLETVALVQPQKIIIKPSADSFDKTRSKIAYQRKTSLCKEIEMPHSFTKIGAKKVTVKLSSTFPEAPNSITVNGNESKKLIPCKGFDIVSQCVRKRVIHMLALKPYKRSELLDRLTKEGISELEKPQVYSMLYKVGTQKEEIFHLRAECWKEVENDWRFYSPEDAAIVQKKKKKACQIHANLVPKNRPSKKGSLVDKIIASPVAIQKKKKTSFKENPGLRLVQYGMVNSTPENCILFPHSASTSSDSASSSSISAAAASLSAAAASLSAAASSLSASSSYSASSSAPFSSLQSASVSSSHTASTSSYSASASTSSHSASASSSSHSASLSSSSHSPSASSCSNSTSVSTTQLILRSMHKILIAVSINLVADDFSKKFFKITSFEQRQRYKEEFDEEYPRYLVLKEPEDRINHLEKKAKSLEGTQEYEAALMPLYCAYKMYFQDSQYIRKKKILFNLHEKLSYIRKLVCEFDTEQSQNYGTF